MSSEFTDDIEDFEPVIEADVEFIAMVESLDVDSIMKCWSESDRSVMMFPGIDMAQGPLNIQYAWKQVAENTNRLKLVLKPISVHRLGDMGWSFLEGTMVSTHGDETLTVEIYVTNVYIREAGGWKIMHHHSTPSPHQPSFLEQRLN